MKVFITDADLAVGLNVSKIIGDASRIAAAYKPPEELSMTAKVVDPPDMFWLNTQIYGTVSSTKPPFIPPEQFSIRKKPSEPFTLEKYYLPGLLQSWVTPVVSLFHEVLVVWNIEC